MPGAIYALQFTSFPGVDGNGVLPTIPAITFSFSNATSMLGNITWDGRLVGGLWRISFSAFQELSSSSSIDSASVQSSYPLAYFPNEASQTGNWLFTGSRNVPESGRTLL